MTPAWDQQPLRAFTAGLGVESVNAGGRDESVRVTVDEQYGRCDVADSILGRDAVHIAP